VNKRELAKKVFPKRLATKIIFLGPKRLLLYFIFQRIFRVNSHVKWPVHWSSIVTHPNKIKRKSELPYLGHHAGCYIQANNGIEIGVNLRYGPNVHIVSASHDILDYEKHIVTQPIVIGDNCWIGAGSIILPGVRLGNHVVVAAGSVVTKSFPDDCLVGGVPAKIIKNIAPYTGTYNGIEK